MQPPQAGRMSNRHLPAGQAMGGPGAGMAMSGSDMAGGHAHMGGGSRRRGVPHGGHGHNHNFGPHHYQPHPGMYGGYMPYPAQYYQGMPPGAGGYQNGPMPSQGYMQYSQAQYSRSPPTMQPYVPMMGIGSPGYLNSRQSQQSPALATPYQPPTVPPSLASHTPSSTHPHSSPQIPPPVQQSFSASQQALSQPLVVSSDMTPSHIATIAREPVAAHAESVAISKLTVADVIAVTLSPSPPPRALFRPPVPWLSRPDLPFPPRTPRKRRKRPVTVGEPVSSPDQSAEAPGDLEEEPFAGSPDTQPGDKILTPMMTPTKPVTTESSYAASEATSSPAPATPTSTQLSTTPTPTTKHVARPPLSAVPTVPVVPVIPKATAKDAGSLCSDKAIQKSTEPSTQSEAGAELPALSEPSNSDGKSNEKLAPTPRTIPKSWASLLTTGTQTTAPKGPVSANGAHINGTPTNGTPSIDDQVTGSDTTAFNKANTSSLADALRSYQVSAAEKVAFIEPRGLINTGNMCFMNSVLQVLIFCIPFYNFLDQVNKKAAHSFKSETPLIDAMVLFIREYKVIDAATSVDQLRRRLKMEEMGQYGEPFTPEFVYEVIRRLPRFVNMRRGHQQDAEEFLGFLLQSLDGECNQVIGIADGTNTPSVTPASKLEKATETSDWLEVGRKQRSAISRSSGQLSSSPISRIFGGLLRSELRVPGLKDSITNEPYQPLQLDIGSPKVHNIIDALKHLTAPETIPGDFNPSRPGVPATKHVSIETLPPVLILHLKRFQFDPATRGTVKLWKNVGYPLELKIPPEVLSRQKRNNLLSDPAGQPIYRLTAVVYHHGINASVGHYTVDVLRQDDREWIRIDDTQIHRITSRDVAEAGAEDTMSHSRNQSPSGQPANRVGAMNGDDTSDEEGWKPVNSSKRWSSVVNGGPAPLATKTKPTKENVKDNRIAYILFYQRV